MTLSTATASSTARRARHLRPRVADFVGRVVEHVAGRVDRYARPAPDSRSLLAEAATAAVHRFLDEMDGAPHRNRGVDELFKSIGHREASANRPLTDFHAALGLSTRLMWAWLQPPSESAEQAVPRSLADALLAFAEHVAAQTELGHAEMTAQRAADPQRARASLAEQLLTGQDTDVENVKWTVPDQSVVAVASLGGKRPDLSALSRSVLVVGHDDSVVVIAAADEAVAVSQRLWESGVERVAVSWPVGPSGIPSAFRWARSALRLVQRGVIPSEPIIDCRAHRTQIWLHSEPYLRQQLTQELLRPLLAETPNSREILSETLLVWLETRDSAPAIAGKLNIHPQTVRYRWKRINELFGDSLHNPDFMVQVTMVLKASVPLWKAGDQSDFERFREESG